MITTPYYYHNYRYHYLNHHYYDCHYHYRCHHYRHNYHHHHRNSNATLASLSQDALIMSHIDCCHTDPGYWDRPLEFRPEHFLDDQGKVVSKKDGFLPFSVGRWLRCGCCVPSASCSSFFLFSCSFLLSSSSFLIFLPLFLLLSASSSTLLLGGDGDGCSYRYFNAVTVSCCCYHRHCYHCY